MNPDKETLDYFMKLGLDGAVKTEAEEIALMYARFYNEFGDIGCFQRADAIFSGIVEAGRDEPNGE